MEPDTLRFLVLAETQAREGLSYPHPIVVALCPAGTGSLLLFSLGSGQVGAGGVVPLRRVLDETQRGLSPDFLEEFDGAELHWLVPFLVRLGAGDDVSEGELAEAYRERHGAEPAVELRTSVSTGGDGPVENYTAVIHPQSNPQL